MSRLWKRREMMAAGAFLGTATAQSEREIEARVETVSARTVRLTIAPAGAQVPDDGALVQPSWGRPTRVTRTVRSGDLEVERAASPLTLTGRKSFRYRQGEWMGIQMAWNDGRKMLSLRLAPGSRMLGGKRAIEVWMAGAVKPVEFEGRPVEVGF